MKLNLNDIEFLVEKMANCIIRNEVPFCDLDSYAGDGDFGMSVAKGFKALKAEWNTLPKESISSFLKSASMIIFDECGGASGPIWGSAFRGAAKSTANKEELSLNDFADMMQAAREEIRKTGERSFGRGAGIGDKTLMDALIPCADSLTDSANKDEDMILAMKKGAKAAVDGAEFTKSIVARMGRAGTVGERSLGYPDAGAYAVGVIFTEIVEELAKRK